MEDRYDETDYFTAQVQLLLVHSGREKKVYRASQRVAIQSEMCNHFRNIS